VKPPHFLIFARPRSRTAWLANFLTYGDAFCLHEPLAEHATLQELARVLDRPFRFGADVQRIGFADTSLIHNPDGALDAFPSARVLFLRSSRRSWERFVRTSRLPHEIASLVDLAYARADARLTGRAHYLDAEELTLDSRAARVAWEITGSRKPFPVERWRALARLNVQIDAGGLAERIRRIGSS